MKVLKFPLLVLALAVATPAASAFAGDCNLTIRGNNNSQTCIQQGVDEDTLRAIVAEELARDRQDRRQERLERRAYKEQMRMERKAKQRALRQARKFSW